MQIALKPGAENIAKILTRLFAWVRRDIDGLVVCVPGLPALATWQR